MIGFNRTRADHRQDHTEPETPGQVDRARHIQVVPRRAATRGPRRFLPPHFGGPSSVTDRSEPTGTKPKPTHTTIAITCEKIFRKIRQAVFQPGV